MSVFKVLHKQGPRDRRVFANGSGKAHCVAPDRQDTNPSVQGKSVLLRLLSAEKAGYFHARKEVYPEDHRVSRQLLRCQMPFVVACFGT